MQTLVIILRWLLGLTLSLVLITSIALLVPLSGISLTLTNSENPKRWLRESKIYDNILPLIIDIADRTASDSEELVLLSNRLKNKNDPLTILLTKKFTPEFTQQSTEVVIEGVYKWFSGQSSKPSFAIAFARDENEMIEMFSILYMERIATMPACTTAQLREYTGNPFELTCKPANISTGQITLFLKSQVNSPEVKELFKQAQFSSDSLQIDPKTTEQVQFWYRIIWLMPVLTGFIMVLSPLLISFIYTTKRFTTYIVHIILMAIPLGIEYLLVIFADNWFFSNFESLVAKIISKDQLLFYNLYFKAGTSAIITDIIKYQKTSLIWALGMLFVMFVSAKIVQYVLKNRRNKVK